MRERLLNLPGYLHERRWLVFVLGVIVEAAFLGPLLAIHSTRYILGIPGSLVALVAVTAGALAGSLVGILVALAGGAVFFASVARFGALSSVPTSLISTGIWCLAALVAGLTADTLRRQSREQERVSRALAQAQSAHETAERILRVAPALHASRDPTELAAQVCRSAQETFGCQAVGLFSIQGEQLRIEALIPSSSTLKAGAVLPATNPGARVLVNVGRPTFVPDLAADSGSDTARLILSELAVRSAVFVPVAAGEEFLALLACGWQETTAAPETESLAAMQRYADLAALALAETRRLAAQEEVSRLHAALEAGLLPRLPIVHPSLSVATRYRPGEARLRLGGDFFDVLGLSGNRAALIIGDVAGHGPYAAALGTTLRSCWRALTMSGADAHTVMETLDRMVALDRTADEVFVTVCLAWIDPASAELSIISAGHPPPLLVGDSVAPLAIPPFLPLGIAATQPWTPTGVKLGPSWTLFFYTDGLIEGRAAPDSLERYGESRLLRWLEDHLGDSNETALEALLAETEAANGGPLADDVAIVVVQRPGHAPFVRAAQRL